MKQSAAFAAIRQIATLGYSGELALPALMTALRDIVAYDKVSFMWLDEEFNVTNMAGSDVVPPDVMRYYLEQFHNKLESEEIPSNRSLMTSLVTDRSATLPKLTGGNLFNNIFRPGGNRHFMRLAIRNGSQPVGILYLLRPPGSRDFTREEEMHLARAAPWLTHALVSPAKVAMEGKLVEEDSGLIIADAKGTVLFFSRGAKELLHRAADVPINPRTIDGRLDWAQALIGRLMQALMGAGDGSAGHDAPALTIRNVAGFFVLRAYWIESATLGAGRNAAIQIQRQVPLPLRLMQSHRLRKLPPREQQACLLLAQGLTSTEIAKRMGISRNGAVYHIRSSYNRLGISRQEELVGILLMPQG